MRILVFVLSLVVSCLSFASGKNDTCVLTIKEGSNPRLSRLMNRWQRFNWVFEGVSTKVRAARHQGKDPDLSEDELDQLLHTIFLYRKGVLYAASESQGKLVPSILRSVEASDYERFFEVYNQAYYDYAELLTQLEEIVQEEEWAKFDRILSSMQTLMVKSHYKFNGSTPKFDKE